MSSRKPLTNWQKAMLVVVALAVLMLIPITRALILFLLPLGSGIDDLIFFVLLACVGILLLIKAASRGNIIERIAKWLQK